MSERHCPACCGSTAGPSTSLPTIPCPGLPDDGGWRAVADALADVLREVEWQWGYAHPWKMQSFDRALAAYEQAKKEQG